MALSEQYIADMRGALLWFHNEVGNYQSKHGPDPAVGSLAAVERGSFCRPESVITAWAIGTLLLEYGAEHLTAFVKTITEPVEVIACWTCVRSMLESCAMSRWLFDPSIDVETRVGRAFSLRYEGMCQQLKYGRAAGVSETEIRLADDRLREIVQTAVDLGFAPVVDRNGRRIGLCVPMPSTTDMIESNLEEGAAYRLLSAVAHGHQWAISSLGFSREVNVHEVGGVPVVRLKKSSFVNGFAYLGLRAMKSLAIPLWAQCHYYGWDPLALEELFEKSADKLCLSPNVRFWRN